MHDLVVVLDVLAEKVVERGVVSVPFEEFCFSSFLLDFLEEFFPIGFGHEVSALGG